MSSPLLRVTTQIETQLKDFYKKKTTNVLNIKRYSENQNNNTFIWYLISNFSFIVGLFFLLY